MSTLYLSFVAIYAFVLACAAVVVLTPRGQRQLVRWLTMIGRQTGVGAWGFLRYPADSPGMRAMALERRALMAEQYLHDVEEQTIRVARGTLWLLIAGCAASALAAVAIVGILPILVDNGTWTYETYVRACWIVVYGTAGGGLLMGAGLVAWYLRARERVNVTAGVAAASSVVAEARASGAVGELATILRAGRLAHLRQMLDELR